MKTILTFMMLGLVTMLSGCAHSLAEIHAVEPWKTGSFQVPFKDLASCAKEEAQIQEWHPETAVIESTDSPSRVRIIASIHAAFSRIVLFEVMIQPTANGGTLVEYRDEWRAHRMREQAWTIINNCASQLSAASAQTSIKRIEP